MNQFGSVVDRKGMMGRCNACARRAEYCGSKAVVRIKCNCGPNVASARVLTTPFPTRILHPEHTHTHTQAFSRVLGRCKPNVTVILVLPSLFLT